MNVIRIAETLEELATVLRRLALELESDEIKTELPQRPDPDPGPHGVKPFDRKLLAIIDLLFAHVSDSAPPEVSK